ncbi:MAG: DUF3592 domain-containing protein [Phycisphaerales bacterium]
MRIPIGLPLFVTGLAAVSAFFIVRLSTHARSWPATSGVIVSASVETIRASTSTGSVRERFRPVWGFQYTVAGRTFSSRQASVSEFAPNLRQSAEQELLRRRVGDPVTVFYDPGNPAEAVLDRGSLSHYWGYLVTAAVATAAAWGGWAVFRSRDVGSSAAGAVR